MAALQQELEQLRCDGPHIDGLFKAAQAAQLDAQVLHIPLLFAQPHGSTFLSLPLWLFIFSDFPLNPSELKVEVVHVGKPC